MRIKAIALLITFIGFALLAGNIVERSWWLTFILCLCAVLLTGGEEDDEV